MTACEHSHSVIPHPSFLSLTTSLGCRTAPACHDHVHVERDQLMQLRGRFPAMQLLKRMQNGEQRGMANVE